MPGGWGVMADDVVAGVLSLMILLVFNHSYHENGVLTIGAELLNGSRLIPTQAG